MNVYRSIIPVLLASCLGFGAETPQPPTPWSDHFTMPLRDQERTFVTYQGTTWLALTNEDLTQQAFLDNKDVTLEAKLMRTDGHQAWFYNLPGIEVVGDRELWRARIDGDNLFLFGHFSYKTGAPSRLTVQAVASAPTDQQVIAARLATVSNDDLDGRLAVGTWIRDQANRHGNREFWLANADQVVSKVIDDIITLAEEKKDIKLVLRAMTLSTDTLHDVGRAARIGSASWIRTLQGSEEVALRMRKLDYEYIDSRWLPRVEAMSAEFESRFNAIPWTDAEAFYKLGLWCDANSDLLPRSRELSYRCFQAGFRANPRNNNIRRELGMDPVTETSSSVSLHLDFSESASGITIKAPEGWQRTDPIDGDATWIDPKSETSYITARLVRSEQIGSDFKPLWEGQLATLQARIGFKNLSENELSVPTGNARHLCYAYKEGRFTRHGDLVLVQNPACLAAVRLEASYAENEQEAVRKQFLSMVQKVIIPASEAKPATDGGKKPQPGTEAGPPPADAAPAPNPQPTVTPNSDASGT